MKIFSSDNTKTNPCAKPETINLNDCLACSGCITSDESKKFQVDASFLNDKSTLSSFIFSKQSKLNIYSYFKSFINLTYREFELLLIQYLRKVYNLLHIVDTSFFVKKLDNKISSECPAVVLYIERLYPALIGLLSDQKTLQQKASDFIVCLNNNTKGHRIISIQQCYDKKDEINRDNTKIDYFLGARDFIEYIKDDFLNSFEKLELNYDSEKWEISYLDDFKEVSGLENCLNVLNKAKKNINEDGMYSPNSNTGLELRICKNGCMSGPALYDSNFCDVDLEKYSNFSDNFASRVFIKPKKKIFHVDW